MTDRPDTGGRWSRLATKWERIGESLFYIPVVSMLTAAVGAQLLLAVDATLDASEVPILFDATVDSSRVLLSVIAGGTITAVAVVFSLTLVAVQLASTQFSPRTLGSFLGDRTQQLIMGLVLGTFVYCLLVLRVIRGPLEDGGDAVIPRASVAMAVALGVASMVAVIASINRTAQSLRVESVIAKITGETIDAVTEQLGEEGAVDIATRPVAGGIAPSVEPPEGALAIAAREGGWIRSIDHQRLVAALPEGGSVVIHRTVGTYVLPGQQIASAWPPTDPESAEPAMARAFVINRQRSRHGDVGFGITRLVDIASRALSPGVNDPTTASEIVLRLGEILVEIAVRDLPPESVEIDGRTVVRGGRLTHGDYIELAIEPIRRFGRTDPAVLATVVRTLAAAAEVAVARRSDAAIEGFDHQIRHVLADAALLDSAADRSVVHAAARESGYPT